MSLISVLNLSFNLRKFIMLNSIFCFNKTGFLVGFPVPPLIIKKIPPIFMIIITSIWKLNIFVYRKIMGSCEQRLRGEARKQEWR